MAKKNKEKKSKGRMEVAKEITPDIRNCKSGSCASDNCAVDDRCKSNK